MINITDKSKCSGCHACANICPKQCIKMELDNEGFRYPVVDSASCINCDLCEKVCPIINPLKNKTEKEIAVYAAYTKDRETRENSLSGGIFSEIAKFILMHKGIVIGAAFNSDWHACHILAEDTDELAKLRGSKYLQSNIGDTYKQTKRLLDEGKLVFFTGTPCQIEGLYSYLNKDYGNLITQDLICHGVPSEKVWDIYLSDAERKAGARIQNVSFRNKDNGWNDFNLKIDFDNGYQYSKKHGEDLFMKSFIKDICLRPSCYNCSFKGRIRPSDITLADFWGIKHIMSDLNDDKGTSLIFVNSEKGNKVFNEIRDKIIFRKLESPDQAIKYNSAMIASSKMHPNRKYFMKNINKKDFSKVLDKSLKVGLIKRVVWKFKSIIKNNLR